MRYAYLEKDSESTVLDFLLHERIKGYHQCCSALCISTGTLFGPMCLSSSIYIFDVAFQSCS